MDKTLTYEEFLNSTKCYLYLNYMFVLVDINRYDDGYFISGMFLKTPFQFKIVNKESYHNFKINKYDGH